MSNRSVKDKFSVQEENISYYDEIANSYDMMLAQEDSNKIIREKVKEKFIGLLPSGIVLDFGGGTGLDLEWLKANGYNIYFCEPSVLMREKAVQTNNIIPGKNISIIFLDSAHTDFTRWNKTLPFSQPVDGVLANFGVINNIGDLNLFFSNLSLVIKPGGHFVATFLERPFRRMFKWHRLNAIRSLLFNVPFIMYVWHERNKQTVFVHTINEIKKAAAPFFNFNSCEFLGGFGFNMIHLTRK